MSNQARIYYLDHVRALAVLSLVPYHAMRIYDWDAYYIKYDSITSIEILTAFQMVWFMPLLFFVAGAATVYSIKKRGAIPFLKERTLRLMIPFVLGIAFLMPFNGYIAYQANNDVTLTFTEYLPNFLEMRSLRGYEGHFSFGHLWFVGYLAGFCLCVPFVIKWIEPINHHAAVLGLPKTALLMLFSVGLVLALTRLTLLPYPNPIYFATFFIAGILVYGVSQMEEYVYRYRMHFLLAGLGTLSVFLFVRLTYDPPPMLQVDDYVGLHWYEAVRGVNALLWVLVIVGFARQLIAAPNQFLLWVNKHGLWFYVIHLPLVTYFAFSIEPLELSSYSSLLIIILLTYFATFPFSILALKLETLITARTLMPRHG